MLNHLNWVNCGNRDSIWILNCCYQVITPLQTCSNREILEWRSMSVTMTPVWEVHIVLGRLKVTRTIKGLDWPAVFQSLLVWFQSVHTELGRPSMPPCAYGRGGLTLRIRLMCAVLSQGLTRSVLIVLIRVMQSVKSIQAGHAVGMRVIEHPCITVCRRDLLVRHKNTGAIFDWFINFPLAITSNNPLIQRIRTLGSHATRRGCFVGRIWAHRTRT